MKAKRHYFPSLILALLTIIAFILAVFFFKSAFPDQQPQVGARTGINVMQNPSDLKKMNISCMVMLINPVENKMELTFDFNYSSKGTYIIGISLPYQVDYILYSVSPPYQGTWNSENCYSGSLVTVSYTANADPEGGVGNVTVGKMSIFFEESIVNKILDTSSLDIPFGGSKTENMYILTLEKNLIKSTSDFPTTLKIALPYSAAITAGTHTPKEKIPEKDFAVWEYYSEEEFSPFYIQYSVAEDRNQFQKNLLLAGIFIGAAFSGAFSTLQTVLELRFKEEKQRTDLDSRSTADKQTPDAHTEQL